MSLTFDPILKKALGDKLLDCPIFKTSDNRQHVLDNLPFRNKVSDSARNDEHAQSIVDTALNWPRGLEMLIDEVYASEGDSLSMRKVLEVLDRASPQPVRWGQVARLKDILKAEKFDDALIFQLCNENRPAGAALPTEGEGHELLRSCIEVLAKWSYIPPYTAPLLAFLSRLLPNIQETAAREECNRWMTSVAQELGMDLQAVKSKAEEKADDKEAALVTQGIPYLLVKVEKNEFNPDEEVLIKGWLYYGGVYKPLHVEVGPHTYDKLPQLMRQLIFESNNELLKKAGKPLAEASKLIIEIFLPLDLLSSEIDQWSVKLGKWAVAPLERHFLVVVRSFDRIYDEEMRAFSWGLWKEKWNQRPMLPKLLTKAHVYLACQASDYTGAFYDKLAQLNLFFLGLTLIPPPGTGLGAAEIFGRMVEAGTPIAIWLRRSGEDMTVVQRELEELIYKNDLDSIPSLIYEKRSKRWDETESSVWKSVSLLWDDPDRLPPDVQAELKAPEE